MEEGYLLGVYAGVVRVGTPGYDQTQDVFQFDYDAAWLASPSRYPLSPHLPLNGGAAPQAIRRFLENLLPEGEALVVAANDAKSKTLSGLDGAERAKEGHHHRSVAAVLSGCRPDEDARTLL